MADSPRPAIDTDATPLLRLAFGLQSGDLYSRSGLVQLDDHWLAFLGEHQPGLLSRLQQARLSPDGLNSREEAALLLETAPWVDAFLAKLFNIDEAVESLRAEHTALAPLFRVKWKFVRRQALLGTTPESLEGFDAPSALARLLTAVAAIDTTAAPPAPAPAQAPAGSFDELAFSRAVLAWQADAPAHAEWLDLARAYCAWAVLTPEGQARHADCVLFRQPDAIDPFDRLRHTRSQLTNGVRITTISPDSIRRRLDHDRAAFALTDPGPRLKDGLDESRYCLLCHKQGNDSCSKGLREEGTREVGTSAGTAATNIPPLRRSAFGEPLAGCPLGERISEFHALNNEGLSIAALAMIVIDNPMVAATGHRICNDCVKACVYQQQTPVDIPQAETRVLRDVLGLPWGFEIYSLLTRWNPLNLRHPLPRPQSGRKVLVVGAGPAGFTLAHHLLNDGHAVLAVDGLKIEPMAAALNGIRIDGNRGAFEPIHDVSRLQQSLAERTPTGFGGVAEYGITVRWDKQFLDLIRLLLERRQDFSLIGGVRFGGTLTVDDAWRLGFDHIALAVGAGRPTTLDIPNGLARGVRTASDFLMALQLSGAARSDAIANLQMRLPVVVIGGGLTAIDTATEALAYYTVQVEKFLARHEALTAQIGEAAASAGWQPDERDVADEFIAHAKALRAERAAAQRQGRSARIAEMLADWGGVTVAYRRRLIDSPAYTLNPEELEHALQEGIRFAECLSPTRIDVDDSGAVASITLSRQQRDASGSWHTSDGPQASVTLDARSVFIAAGTHANTVLAEEDPDHFPMQDGKVRLLDETGAPAVVQRGNARPDHVRVLIAGSPGERWMSCFGDVHPGYSGNVVKAMASAKQGWPVVSRVLAQRAPACAEPPAEFLARLNTLLRAHVVRVERLGPAIVEVVIHAPLAAARFQPGQFYRLQSFESNSPVIRMSDGSDTRLATEGLAMTGAWVDRDAGLVSTIVLEMGGSSSLCSHLRPGEPVILMGPTGTPTEIAPGETVVLVGGGLGNAVLFSIGAAFRRAGSRVLYFAGYKRLSDRFKVAEIEAAADVVVWCCDESPGFKPGRPQDRAFDGDIVQALHAWADGAALRTGHGSDHSGQRSIPLNSADRLIVIGSDRMMAAVARARQDGLAGKLKPGLQAIGSINSPMQCMMKAICGQCLQPQIDPLSGRTRLVFSCVNQDQPLDEVDFEALDQRLRQNALQEKQTARWIAQALGVGNVDSATPAPGQAGSNGPGSGLPSGAS